MEETHLNSNSNVREGCAKQGGGRGLMEKTHLNSNLNLSEGCANLGGGKGVMEETGTSLKKDKPCLP